MIINLSQILSGRTNKQSFDATVEVESNQDFSLQGVMATDSIHVTGEIKKSDARIMMNCSYETTWKFQCGRCLSDVERTISGSLYKEIVKHEISEDEEEMDFITMKSEGIEISEIVLNEVILNLPLQILCSGECKGLCPSCGVNRNTDPCDCDNETIDPRLADLKNFFQ